MKNDKLAMKMQMDKKIVQIYTSLETNKAVRFEELNIKLQWLKQCSAGGKERRHE